MLTKIIQFSVRNKLIVGLFTLALILFGSYQITKLPIDAVPDITDNQVQVITITPSLGAPDVERLITFPIEQVNSNIPGLKQIRSFSRFGLSVVTIVFEDNVDVYWARQQVTERLQQVQNQIPAEFGKPELAPVTTGLGEIYQYVVRPKNGYEGKYDAMELRTIQDWIVRRQLLGTPGVADVASFGGYLKQYEIAVNPGKLKSYNLSINDIFTALQKNNQNTGGAYIEKGPQALFIRSEGLVTNEKDIGSIVVKMTEEGIPVSIRDVAEVHKGHATRYGAMTYNDKGEVAGAVVMMLKGENSSAVINRVKEKVKQIQKTLPEGVVIEPFLDRTKMVSHAISTVKRNLIEGALIVLFVLVLFLGNLRAGFVVASVIPLSMLFAVILMNLFGVSGNLMSLGAIDFGLIVDGAVIIVEAVMHRLMLSNQFRGLSNLNQDQMNTEVEQTAARMMKAAIFGQIIILIVYLPIFSLQGIEGKMFRPMAQTVTFALLGAFLLSLTYVPMVSSWLLSKKTHPKKSFGNKMMEKAENFYHHMLEKSFKRSKAILITALLLFAGSVFVLLQLGGEFIPKLEEGDFATETRVLTGSNLNTSIDVLTKSAHILLRSFSEVEKVVGKNGSSEIPTDPMPLEASDMMIILKDKSEWKSAKTFDELAKKMNDSLQQIPGATFGFQYPVQMRFNELISGAKQDVVCKIYGEDLDSLTIYANKLGSIVSSVKGLADVYVETVIGMPQVVIKYNRAAMAQYGLNVADINSTVNAAFAGQSAGMVFEGEKRFSLVVKLDTSQRKGLSDVQNLLIPTKQGTQIPLYQVADVQATEGPNQIQREQAKRRIIVGFNVRGRDVKSVVNELQGKVEKQLKLSPGYYVEYGGAFENLEAAQRRLMIAVPLSLLLIFLMLYFAFKSIRQGILIYSAIPLSAIGGILFLALRGMPFSISAGVGFIALFGVAVLNGIVLISEFNRLKKEEGITDIDQIVFQGTKTRLRPVLMTAAVASLGFIPMALSHGAGAEVQRPLATVVIGGLISSTLLTLFVLPILYVFAERRSLRTKGKAAMWLFIPVLLCASSLKAQQSISLQAALDSTLKNNLAIKSSQLSVKYYQSNKGTAVDIPKTGVMGEYGQFNSYYNDTKVGISQTISFPMVYVRNNRLLDAELQKGESEHTLKETEIKAQVKKLFYEILVLKEKEKLLSSADSAYKEFLSKAALRLQKGESNVLEKTTAQAQRQQLFIQLQQLRISLYNDLRVFNQLLNSSVTYQPAGDLKYQAMLMDSSGAKNPYLLVQQKQIGVAEQSWKLQKSRLWPDLMAGYYNQSIQGWQKLGGTDTYFDNRMRFNSIQGGINFPLFFHAQGSRIKSSKYLMEQAKVDYENGKQQYNSVYSKVFEQLKANLQTVATYENNLITDADKIVSTANLQFQGGAINYLEWTMLVNQAISIKTGYLNTIEDLNNNYIQLELLSGTN